MIVDSFAARQQPLLASASVACHATFRDKGFRQRDLKFYFELFSHWSIWEREDRSTKVQTTQLTRYLERLGADGFAVKIKRTARAPYRLTRLGLIEMLSRVVSQRPEDSNETFLFAFYFIRAYRERLIDLVKSEGRQFPTALRIELEALLDYRSMLREKIASKKRILRKLQQGIEDAEATSTLTQNLLKRRLPLKDIIVEVEKLYPYEFNSLKPLNELMSELPADNRAWELEHGNMFRSKMLWQPAYAVEKAFLGQLEQLASQNDQ